jgi:hypothetical protein
MCYNGRVGRDRPRAGASALFFHPLQIGGLMSAETLNEETLGKIVPFVFTQKNPDSFLRFYIRFFYSFNRFHIR